MPKISLLSPAKLNLYLKVLNKRPDGFHDIVTLFERIDLCDEISISSNTHKNGDIRIYCDHPQVPLGPKNLVHQATRLIQQSTGIQKGVEIKIKKRIPVAAGLAGGSSNAATVLLGLNQIWKLGLSRQKLVSYAQKLGSDVAFFLYDAPFGLGTGRGEKIKKFNVKTELWHVVIVPRIKMYSWKVYGELSLIGRSKLQLTKIHDNVNILLHYLKQNDLFALARMVDNDLEPVVVGLCPKILKLQKRLKSLNAKGVMISGSGPSVFGTFENEQEAKQVCSIMQRTYSQVYVVKNS